MSIIEWITGTQNSREQAIEQLAFERRMDYQKFAKEGQFGQLGEFTLFKKGRRHKFYNVISFKRDGTRYCLFDYNYTVQRGNSRRTFRQSVFYADSIALTLPEFRQKPETFFDRLMELIGLKDIDFADFENYSNRYRLEGPFENVIRHYFSKEILKLLSLQQDMNMEGMNYYFLLYPQSNRIAVSNLNAFIDLGFMITELFQLQSDKARQLLGMPE
ncbi:MAG: hypothetical protein IT266_04730 [Saprospiraceae bacterium]|nr:hypothetical protein [Saprospiraceae bacterium]